MRRVVLLGSTGMLGSMVEKHFATVKDMTLTALDRRHVNAEVHTCLEDLLVDKLDGYEYAINCIGVIKPFIHDDNPVEVERAIRVNAIYPHILAKAAADVGCKVLSIATDCVYSGRDGNYAEGSPADATDVYGKTKALGEVHSANVHHLRCSIIGPEVKGHVSLLDWFLAQPEGSKLKGFTHHSWNGVTTLAFAKVCEGIIRNDIKLGHMQHIIPADLVTKYELLCIFNEVYGKGFDIERINTIGAPRYGTLTTTNPSKNMEIWDAAGYPSLPSIRQMVEEMAEFGRKS